MQGGVLLVCMKIGPSMHGPVQARAKPKNGWKYKMNSCANELDVAWYFLAHQVTK